MKFGKKLRKTAVKYNANETLRRERWWILVELEPCQPQYWTTHRWRRQAGCWTRTHEMRRWWDENSSTRFRHLMMVRHLIIAISVFAIYNFANATVYFRPPVRTCTSLNKLLFNSIQHASEAYSKWRYINWIIIIFIIISGRGGQAWIILHEFAFEHVALCWKSLYWWW